MVIVWLVSAAHAGGSVDKLELVRAVKVGDCEQVAQLLAVGTDPDARDGGGRSALWWAAISGHCDLVTTLLESGANPQLRDDHGDSPLRVATKKGHTEVVRLLLAAGAPPEPWWRFWIEFLPTYVCLVLVTTLLAHFMIRLQPPTGLAPLVELLDDGRGLLTDQGLVVAEYAGRIAPRSELWGYVAGRAVALFQRPLRRGVALAVPVAVPGRQVLLPARGDEPPAHIADSLRGLAALGVQQVRLRKRRLELDRVAGEVTARVLEGAVALGKAMDGEPGGRSLAPEGHGCYGLRVLSDEEHLEFGSSCWSCAGTLPERKFHQGTRSRVPLCAPCQRRRTWQELAPVAGGAILLVVVLDYAGRLVRPITATWIQGDLFDRVLANTLSCVPYLSAAAAAVTAWWLVRKLTGADKIPGGRSLLALPSGRIALMERHVQGETIRPTTREGGGNCGAGILPAGRG